MTAGSVCHLGLWFCIQTFVHFTLPYGKIDCATLRNAMHKRSNSLGVAYLYVAIVTLVLSYVSTCHNIEYFTMCHHGHHIPISHHVSLCVIMVTMYHCISQCCCMSVCHHVSSWSPCITVSHNVAVCQCVTMCHHGHHVSLYITMLLYVSVSLYVTVCHHG